MGYVDIGDVRFERGFVVLCDCRRQEGAPMTGVRVVLKQGDDGWYSGTCRVCGNYYAMRPVVAFERGEAREALNIAAATP